MQQYNKYVRKWQDLSIKLNEAMQKDNFDEADKLIKECNEAYEKYKECSSYPNKNREMTFGELNYMLESELTNLFKKNKKALKECTNLIKSDKNLLSEFKFIDSLRKYNCEDNPQSYVRESIELASKTIDKKTLRESINKFADLLSKYEIGNKEIDEEMRKYYKDCEAVLSENKKLTNLTKYTNSVNSIASYIENHKANINEGKGNIKTMIESLEDKIANLSEQEQSLVKDIIDFKNPMVEEKQKKLFNQFKNECLSLINKLMEDSSNDSDTEGLKAIKEQIERKEYYKESVVQEIAKILEVRDILLEK